VAGGFPISARRGGEAVRHAAEQTFSARQLCWARWNPMERAAIKIARAQRHRDQ